MRLITLLFFVSTSAALSIAQNWNWAVSYGGDQSESVPAYYLTEENESLLAGSFRGIANFGASSLEAIQGNDAYLAKADDQGAILWAVSGGSTSNDLSMAVESDEAGNIYWLGQFWVEAYFDNDTIRAGSNSKAYFIAKYSSAGELIWVESIKGSAVKSVNDLAIDASGDIYLTGYFSDSLMVDEIVLVSDADENAFILKISETGMGQWAMQYGESGTIRPQKIELTGSGDLVIAGHMTGAVTFGASELNSVVTDFDIFVARFNAFGLPLWGRIGTGVFDNILNALEIDDSDNIYLSGNFFGVIDIEGAVIQTPGNLDNLYLIKITPGGSLVWARALNDQVFNDPSFSFDLAVRNDLVLMCGQFLEELIVDDLQISGLSIFQGFMASFDADDGTVEKLSRIPGTQQTSGIQIEVDDIGQTYIAGVFQETVSFGSTELLSMGGTDLFLAQASSTFTSSLTPNEAGIPIQVYPNPARETLYIETPEAIFSIRIFNAIGQVVVSSQEREIQLSGLQSGMYWLQYEDRHGQQMIGFVKVD